jgi:hypothetical protein
MTTVILLMVLIPMLVNCVLVNNAKINYAKLKPWKIFSRLIINESILPVGHTCYVKDIAEKLLDSFSNFDNFEAKFTQVTWPDVVLIEIEQAVSRGRQFIIDRLFEFAPSILVQLNLNSDKYYYEIVASQLTQKVGDGTYATVFLSRIEYGRLSSTSPVGNPGSFYVVPVADRITIKDCKVRQWTAWHSVAISNAQIGEVFTYNTSAVDYPPATST